MRALSWLHISAEDVRPLLGCLFGGPCIAAECTGRISFEPLFAEVPFGLVTVLFVLCNLRNSNPFYEALAALFAVTAFLLRAAGVALFVAWVAESLARKQFKRAAVRLLISAIPVLCWNAYVVQVEGGPSYSIPAYPYQRAPYLNYNVSYATNLALVDYTVPSPAKRQPCNWQSVSGKTSSGWGRPWGRP